MSSNDRWSNLDIAEWKGRVGAQVEMLGGQVREIFDQLRDQNKEITNIKAKSAGIGVAVAIIMNLVFMLIHFYKTKNGG